MSRIRVSLVSPHILPSLSARSLRLESRHFARRLSKTSHDGRPVVRLRGARLHPFSFNPASSFAAMVFVPAYCPPPSHRRHLGISKAVAHPSISDTRTLSQTRYLCTSLILKPCELGSCGYDLFDNHIVQFILFNYVVVATSSMHNSFLPHFWLGFLDL
ncbi:hypothetical protein B0H11DRAFT_355642 [Mycena galericulata]|nr:hypothetical protein B0H11DRAFT_355642 [Mycena galericulata]